MQFEILPYAEADHGTPFGIGCDISINDDGFKPGGPDWYTEDSSNPVNGATAFGRDHLQGTTWQWDMHVNRDQTANAAKSLGELATAWRARYIRDEVGAVLSLRYQLAGRTRRIFGRPRRFEYSPNNLILGGYVPISADFKCVDSLTYDDEPDSVVLQLEVTPTGGLIFPTIFPSTSLPSGARDSTAVVSGDADTYPVIRFDGPVTNPSIETADWAISLDMTINDGEFVEIDTRPWAQTVLLNGSTSAAGALGKRQWLSAMKLSPGQHDFVYRGSATSGGATCEVRWRSAWNSI
jgi:hypothetical protein